MSPFSRLFRPIRIRDLEIRNRILSTGHQTYLGRDGMPTDELAAYHEALSRLAPDYRVCS
jgi:2,4-dienoyl-CoA reductase-like NADH-dependent reductase (Old Yellow Enzyme family)